MLSLLCAAAAAAPPVCVAQASAVDYFSYSRHLASWGFAVLQYDFNLLGARAGSNGWLHTDAAEVSGEDRLV